MAGRDYKNFFLGLWHHKPWNEAMSEHMQLVVVVRGVTNPDNMY